MKALGMKIKETFSIEDFGDSKYKIRIVEPAENRRAIITHYLNNKTNGVAEIYKKDAVNYINDFLDFNNINSGIAADEAIQYFII
ncbi:MAG: hypothetical protein IPL08_15090 [Saprospiraceae bacterium]|nr:hypothetical protein [Saprospiraceae bacterium]